MEGIISIYRSSELLVSVGQVLAFVPGMCEAQEQCGCQRYRLSLSVQWRESLRALLLVAALTATASERGADNTLIRGALQRAKQPRTFSGAYESCFNGLGMTKCRFTNIYEGSASAKLEAVPVI
jgi:hypothetical protein